MTARIFVFAAALLTVAPVVVDSSIAAERCVPDFTGEWHLSTVEGPITLHIKMDPSPPKQVAIVGGGYSIEWRLMGYGTDANGRNGYLCALAYPSGQQSVNYAISIDWSIPTNKYTLAGICSGRTHELTDFFGTVLGDGTIQPDQNGYSHIDHATNHVFKEGYPYQWTGKIPCAGIGPFSRIVPATRIEPDPSGRRVREPPGGGFARCAAPIVSDPGGVAGLTPPMTGTFDTDFGKLTLGPNGGNYSVKNGHVCITKIIANIMEGTWTQSDSAQRCADGTYRGLFRFTFDQNGFTGTYGYCDRRPSAGPWNGRRL